MVIWVIWIVLGHDVLRSPVQVYTSVEAVDEPMTVQVEETIGGASGFDAEKGTQFSWWITLW
jgi:hypothetical protein